MATTAPGSKPAKKSKAEKKTKVSHSTSLDKLKAVVRRLPPNLPQEIFWQSVQPWVTDETVSWRVFYSGKIRKKSNKENIPSRAYIAFRNAGQLAAFSQAYDGHVFRDKAGNESFAVVEFAPFQKTPSEKRKADPRMGTIEQDEDYISFLQTLSTSTSKPSETDTLEALIAASQPPPQPKSTPLLDALRAEKQAQRDRETILKAHAHYRDHKGEFGSRRKGKQAMLASVADHDENTVIPGQVKRHRRGKKGDATVVVTSAKAKGKETTPAAPAKVAGKAVAKPAAQEVSTAVPKETGKEVQERRPRPAIGIGLASRQIEAALAGAGVLPAGGSGPKSRRERARERKGGEEGEKPDNQSTPASPGREHGKGVRKRGDSMKGHVAGTNDDAPEKTTTPSILPRPSLRPGVLPRPPPVSTEAAAINPTLGGSGPKQPGSGAAAEGRGGRRRGRGRGAGRGGAPTGVA